MEPSFVTFLAWAVGVGITWMSARAILEVLKDKGSENKRALWIAVIFCTPIIGAAIWWCFGQAASNKEDLAAKESLLKARLNASAASNE